MACYVPPCPHYPDCFGCPLIALPYREQLRKKHSAAVRALSEICRLARVEVPPLIPSPRRLGYRGRVKLVVQRGNGGILTGLYVPGSHRVVDISSCPVHPQPVNRVVKDVKKLVAKLDIDAYDEATDRGDLRYLDIRCSFFKREVVLTLVTRHDALPRGVDLAKALMGRFPFVAGVVQNVNEERGNVIWGKRFRPLAGRDAIVEKVGFAKLIYPASAFSQANPSMARKLYETVVTAAGLSGREAALDLYCGVGPISLYLAAAARVVWGVEENVQAIATAKQNARANGFGNCRFFVGDVADKAKEAAGTLGRVDLIVANPPRKGLGPEAVEAIESLGAPRLIYVSCDPATLARDLLRLTEGGYRLTRLQPFDMLPQTVEIETVALLQKA